MRYIALANIFSHSVGVLFTFFIMLLDTEVLRFDQVQVILFVVDACAVDILPKNASANTRSQRFMSSSKSFTALAFFYSFSSYMQIMFFKVCDFMERR